MQVMETNAIATKEAVLTFDDLVEKHCKTMTNLDLQIRHAKNGTIDEFYHQLISDFIADLTILPIHRDHRNLDPLNDKDIVSSCIMTIISMLSTAFGKPIKRVELDIKRELNNFPVEDVREAARLKINNRLH